MQTEALIALLQQKLPTLLAIYAFGSRIQQQGQSARPDSDLDLAVLLETYADPIVLFELSGELADNTGCPVDLLDMRAASTVMQHQILTQGETWWRKNVQAGLFEAAMLSEKMTLDEARAGLIQDVRQRGRVYGR